MPAYLSGFENRFKITIDRDKIDTDLADFPVMLHLSSSSGQGAYNLTAIFDELTSDANRKKIAVTTSDGETQCYVEIEWWDEANELAILHVKVPAIAKGDNSFLYLYYDSTASDNTTYVGDTGDAVAQNVWDANFVAVYHMATDPSGGSAFLDSTENGNDGTMAGTMLAEDLVDGLKGARAIDFDGSDDCFEINEAIVSAFPFTFEAITQRRSSHIGGIVSVVDKDDDDQMLALEWRNDGGGGSDNCLSLIGVAGSWELLRSGALDVDTWYGCAGVFTDATDKELFVNGVSVGTMTASKAVPTVIDRFSVGRMGDSTPGSYVDGLIGDIRVSDIARSDAWIKATYYTLYDDLVTYSPDRAGWVNGFDNRLKITIDHSVIDADLTDFPVMLNLSDSSGKGDVDLTAIFDELTSDANRKKIAVTTSDGETQCYVEIELWDDATETAILHVKVPAVDDDISTALYLYYDADANDNDTYVGDTGDEIAENVWDANFIGVWHLNQDPSGGAGCMLDSTSNSNDGTPSGTMLTGDLVAGLQGARAIDFDGSDDIITATGYKGIGGSNNRTLEYLLNTSSSTRALGGFGNDDTTGKKYYNRLQDSGESPAGVFRAEFNGSYVRCPSPNLLDGEWHHCASKLEGTTAGDVDLLVDGNTVIETESNPANTLDTDNITGHDLTIGGYHDVAWAYFTGKMGEVRLSDIARSDAWLKATYYSLFDNLVSYGESDGWLAGFNNRVQLDIDSSVVDADLEDFPVTIFLSAAAGIGDFDARQVFEKLQIDANRKKIAVATADGLTQCYVEIEYWSHAEKTAVLHAKIPYVESSADTTLFLYFDQTASDNDSFVGDTGDAAAQSVWDSNFNLVMHMAQDPSGGAPQMLDSTSNGNNLTSQGTMLTEDLVDSPPGKGIDFDGSNDGLYDSAGYDTENDTEQTLEAIINPDSVRAGDKDTIINNWGAAGVTYYGSGLDIDDGDIRALMVVSTSAKVATGAAVSLDTDQYAAARWKSGETVDVFLNDAKTVGVSGTGALSRNGDKWEIGTSENCYVAGTRFFDGTISEVRGSLIKRPDAWIKATYHSLFDSLITISNFETQEYKKRRKITIDSTNIDATLTDFPLTIQLSASAGTGTDDLTDIFTELGSNDNRFKIKITLDDLETQLPVEIEYFDVASNVAVLHTKIPSLLASADTEIYLHYDADQPDNTDYVGDTGDTPAQSVWDSNFVAVYHMSQDPSGGAPQMLDSTSKGNDMTATGAMTTGDLIDAEPGKGIEFDGSNDGLYKTAATDVPTDYPMTLEAAGPVIASSGINTSPFVCVVDASATDQVMAVYNYNELARLMAYNSSAEYANGTAALSADTFYHLAGVFTNSTDRHVMTNGADKVQDTASKNFASNVDKIAVGHFGDSSPTYLAGKASEARISDIARSDAWIKATYYSLGDLLIDWTAEEGPWLDTWEGRRRFTIDASLIDEALFDFPIALSIDASCGLGSDDLTGLFTELSTANRAKMAVTMGDKKTELFVELENWDSSGSKGFVHVRVPRVDPDKDTEIYLHYDADQDANTSFVGDPGDVVVQSVWDSSFVAVYHLSEDPSGGADAMKDSTVNNQDGTSAGTMLTEDLVDGLNGARAIDFDGSDDYISVADSAILDAVLSPNTIEAIIKTTADFIPAHTDYHGLIYKGWDLDEIGIRFYERAASSMTRLETGGSSSVVDNDFANGEWKHVAGVIPASGNDTLFIDGVEVAAYNVQIDTTFVTSDYDLRIGDSYPNTGDFQKFDGLIGEVRLSDIARSDAWLKATYETLFDILGTWGSEEEYVPELGDEDVNVAVTTAAIVVAANAVTVSAGVAVTTAAIVVAANPVTVGAGVSVGTAAVVVEVPASTITQNLNAIGIMSKPTVSGAGPGATATGKQPGATATGAGPGANVTGKGD